jgi:NAD(P)-dependent dehydrogenase (short-subunit alcohol dehydrogenase family)
MDKRKVAVVMGVGPGLGAAVARRFGREHFAVALMARGEDKLRPVKEQIESAGGVALALPTDGTDAASVAASFAHVRQELGEVEVLVYNAGAFKIGGILDIAPEEFESTWRANCSGAFLAAQQVLPAMVAQKHGTILLTGATASMRGSARFACLAVGKFGLRALSQCIAREFGPQGIHVAHVIVDGQIDTPWLRSMQPGRELTTLLEPDAMAETYWQLHIQHPTAWTLELDVRPAVEKF